MFNALAPAVLPPNSGKIVEVAAAVDGTAPEGIAEPAVSVT